MLLLAGLSMASSLLLDQRVVRELATPIVDNLGDQADAEFQALLDPIRTLPAVDVQRIRQGLLPLRDTPTLKRLLLPAM